MADNTEGKIKSAEKDIVDLEKDIQYFDRMVSGAEKLIKPWRFSLILTNLFWAVVFTAFILLAYLTPTQIDVQQNQGAVEQKQEQSVKGAN